MGRGLDGFFSSRDARVALCSFEGPGRLVSPFSGGFSEGETPLPIPNREVKPLSADGTWLARAWESRTPPVSPSEAIARDQRRSPEGEPRLPVEGGPRGPRPGRAARW